MEVLISAEEVNKLFKDCLFLEDELENGLPKGGVYIKAEGVMIKAGLHPLRVESHKVRVGEIIANLPTEFITGGGWAFQNMCNDKNGMQWGEHKNMDELLCLAIATGQGRKLLGGMPMAFGLPYVEFAPGGFKEDKEQPCTDAKPAAQPSTEQADVQDGQSKQA